MNAREIIANAVFGLGTRADEYPSEVADAVLAALSEAGYTVARPEGTPEP